MGSELLVYLRLGVEHILDPAAYDHLLFIVALTAIYPPRAWRRVVILVTAFTVGHSLTLALATLGGLGADAALVELLIALTIVATALLNVGELRWEGRGPRVIKYLLALGFGLIHGMGFSTFLRAALGAGGPVGIPLLGFNLGVEAGQLLVVGAVVAATWLATEVASVPRRSWTLLLSAATGGMALILAVGRLPL